MRIPLYITVKRIQPTYEELKQDVETPLVIGSLILYPAYL